MRAAPTSPVVDDLVGALGAHAVRSAPLDRRLFSKDAGVTRGEVVAITFPTDARQVSQVVQIAARHGLPIVVRGAGTGLAGGAVPSEPSVLIVTTRMDGIEVDAANRTAWVGPGVINLDLSRRTSPLGLHFAPDPSSQAACTLGGNVANNSGGPHCLAEGSTVYHVLAVEFVDAAGEVVTVGGAAPDPIGLDVRGVVVGSEGTLGVVTRILVRLSLNPPATKTMLLGFREVSGAAATVSEVIASGIVPAALEMMDRPMIGAVENFVHAGLPIEAAAVLLAEVSGHPAGVDAEADLITAVGRRQGATSVRIAADERERGLFWKARKSAFGAIAQIAPDYYLHDTVIPRTRLVEALDGIYAIARQHDLLVMNVVHAGDGNLHPQLVFDASVPGQLGIVKKAAEEMVEMSIGLGGMLSGEHGIGLEKRDLMPLVFSAVDLDAQARLREAFDPGHRFNPGTMLPAGSRCLDFGRPVREGAWV